MLGGKPGGAEKDSGDAGQMDMFLSSPVTVSVLFDGIMELFGEEISRRGEFTKSTPPAPVKTASREMPENGRLAGKRILVVEDNQINRQLARELLKTAGITVFEAENGAEALERLGEGAVDAVLMDVQMPVMDGYQAHKGN